MGSIKITREIELDEHDVNRIKDVVYGLFKIKALDIQIQNLVNSFPEWDCDTDTIGIDQLSSMITKKMINKKLPTYGDSQEYKESIWKELEDKKQEFIKILNNEK